MTRPKQNQFIRTSRTSKQHNTMQKKGNNNSNKNNNNAKGGAPGKGKSDTVDAGLVKHLELRKRVSIEKPNDELFSVDLENFSKINATVNRLFHLGDNTVSILSYNVLSEASAQSNWFPKSDPEHLKWLYRSKNLMHEITHYKPDIFCLQEVEKDAYKGDFVPFFSTGFDSVYKQRTANKNDGCAIFWDRNRFYSMGQKDVEFDDIVHLPENANATAEQKRDWITRNIATIVVLATPEIKPFIVACCHLWWHPNHEILRLKQSQYLTQNVAQLSEDLGLEDPAVFICGDFNSRWGSDVTQFMKNRKDTLPNPLPNLHSAYDYFLRHLFNTDDEKQLEKALNTYHTQFTHELKCHIDYIWFNNHNTQVMEVLELLDEEKILTSCGVSLPSKYYSSDHVALMATFKVPNIQ